MEAYGREAVREACERALAELEALQAIYEGVTAGDEAPLRAWAAGECEAPPAQGAGAFYMRGKPPRTSDALSNELDVLSVEVWEVAVGVVVDEETGRRETKWIRAPGITMTRGGGGGGGGGRGEAKEEL